MAVIHELGFKCLQNNGVKVYVDCILVQVLRDYGTFAHLYTLCSCVVFVGALSLSHMWKPVVIMLLIQSLFLTNSILLVAFLVNMFIVIVYFGFMVHFPFLLHLYNLTMGLAHGFLLITISYLHTIKLLSIATSFPLHARVKDHIAIPPCQQHVPNINSDFAKVSSPCPTVIYFPFEHRFVVVS